MIIDTDRITQLVYELLNEYDIEIWKRIQYTDLADFWVKMIRKTYEKNPDMDFIELEELREEKLRNFLFEENEKYIWRSNL